MYQNKDEEIRMKRLKRLPDIARLITFWLKQYSEVSIISCQVCERHFCL